MRDIELQKEDLPAKKFLNGWKEIATYLGLGVRTVQRYERELSLPVRRPSGRMRGAVIANCLELQQWMFGSPRRRQNGGHHIVLENLRASVAENHRLRLETEQLRDSLQTSIETLQRTIDKQCKRDGWAL